MNKLSDYLEENGIIYDQGDLAGYSSDASFLTLGTPQIIVFPATEEELIKLVDYACNEGLNLVPRGSGTSTAGSSLADENSILVDMERVGVCNRWGHRPSRLNVESVSQAGDAVDLNTPPANAEVYVRAAAGATSDEINHVISASGWTVAVVPSSGYSTLGGNFATNARGPGTPKYGAFGETVNRLRMVVTDSDGAKAIAIDDTDEIRRLAGNHGLFGFVTELDVKIVPQEDPARSLCAAIAIEQPTMPQTAEILGRIMHAVDENCQFRVGEFLFVDDGMGELSNLAKDAAAMAVMELKPNTRKCILMYRGDKDQIEKIRAICGEMEGAQFHDLSPKGFEQLLAIRKQSTGRSAGRVALPGFEDILVKNPLQMGEVLGRMFATIEGKLPGRPIGHHYRDGAVIHYRPQARLDSKELAEAWDLTQQLREQILVPEFDVDMRVEHGMGLELMQLSSQERRDEIIRLKSKYDPRGVFNQHLMKDSIPIEFVGTRFAV